MSVRKKMMNEMECAKLLALIRAFGLPTELRGMPSSLMEAIMHDKKKAGMSVNMVLLRKIGKAKVVAMTWKELETELRALEWQS